MFETAELGQKVAKKAFAQRSEKLRLDLLKVQHELRKRGEFPVIVVFAGVDGAGKSETANLLNSWMDPRYLRTHAYTRPTESEAQQPPFWRYWKDLPERGLIALYLRAWYSEPVVDRVYDRLDAADFDQQLERIRVFEKALIDDGALIIKFWMHLDRKGQKRRFKRLLADPQHRWRVTKRDQQNLKKYDRFIEAGERAIAKTSKGGAPWIIVEGADFRHAALTVGTRIHEAIEERLAQPEQTPEPKSNGSSLDPDRPTVLGRLDMSKKLSGDEYRNALADEQARLAKLHRKAKKKGISTVAMFEGWDAAGKGGAIRRITEVLDARDYRVVPVAAPSDEERARHYLWRFWRHLWLGPGRTLIFDRSWYGRVLVERIEGFARRDEWRRAYAEIVDFEDQLVEHGVVLLKFWVHITNEEQLERFEARKVTPHKAWKLTDEDWRNRDQWSQYELAVHDMVQRTSRQSAPWTLVEGNDKRYARVKVIKTMCDRLEQALG